MDILIKNIDSKEEHERRYKMLRPSFGWSKSHIFGRCHCNGLTINGICQSCGFVTICSHCNNIKQADNSWKPIRGHFENASHGVCIDCLRAIYPKVYRKMKNNGHFNSINN